MAANLEALTSTKTTENQTQISEADAARELVRMAKEQGLSLTGPDGLRGTGKARSNRSS